MARLLARDSEKAAVYARCPTLADFQQQRSSLEPTVAAAIYNCYNLCKFNQRTRHATVVTHEEAYRIARDTVLQRVRSMTALRPTVESPEKAYQHVPDNCLQRVEATAEVAKAFPAITSRSPHSHNSGPPDSSDAATPSPPSSPLSPACDSHYTHSLPASSSSGSSSLTTPPHCAGCDAWRAMYEQVRQPSNSDDVAGIADKLREADEQSGDLMRAVESLQQRVAWLEQQLQRASAAH